MMKKYKFNWDNYKFNNGYRGEVIGRLAKVDYRGRYVIKWEDGTKTVSTAHWVEKNCREVRSN
jgi:hypothetical protein